MPGDSAMSEEALRQLAQSTEALGLLHRRFSQGDTVLRLGEQNDVLYVVLAQNEQLLGAALRQMPWPAEAA